MRLFAFKGALITFAMLVLPTTSNADDEDIIDYREHIMNTMAQQYAAIDLILQKKAPLESFDTHVQALAITAATALASFESNVPGGHAKPLVWKQWTDFSKRMNDFAGNLATLAKTANSGGIAAAGSMSQASLKCSSCHEIYCQSLDKESTPPPPSPLPNPGDKDVIDYREHIMNTLNEQSDALGMILSTTIPPDNAMAHLEILALTASTALKAFEPKVLGGQSKPEVWSNWPDFSKRMNELATNTAKMAKVAQQKGAQTALAGVVDGLTCKSCHEVYRQEKTK